MFKVSKQVVKVVIKKSFYPFIILLFLLGSYMFYILKISPTVSIQIQKDIKKYIVTAFIICIVFIIQRIVGAILSWYKEKVTAKTKTQLDNKLIPLLRRAIKVAIWVIALLMILPLYGINISALIAALGVGSLAIALAAQDTIANIIAGFLIMIDVPFKVGDKIKLPSGELVEVLEIGVRRSKFLSEDKAIVIVPNLELSKSKIINYSN